LTNILDNNDPNEQPEPVQDLAVVETAAAALAMLDPIRARILAALAEPGSATSLSAELGLSRQRVSYHLKALEAHDLVHLHEEKPKRGLTERVMVASARSYVLSPSALGQNASDPDRVDQMSANYLIALASRIVREVADLARRAAAVDKRLPTLAIDTDIRFATAADRAAFAADLSTTVTALAAKYHDETAPRGSWYRVAATAHPRPAQTQNKET